MENVQIEFKALSEEKDYKIKQEENSYLNKEKILFLKLNEKSSLKKRKNFKLKTQENSPLIVGDEIKDKTKFIDNYVIKIKSKQNYKEIAKLNIGQKVRIKLNENINFKTRISSLFK